MERSISPKSILKLNIVLFLLLLIIVITIYFCFIALPNEFKYKLWPHRVNSIERLQGIKNNAVGVELDVVFQKDQFDVNHPPAPSIGLSLDKFFSERNSHVNFQYWIDFKNLNEQNKVLALIRLQQLCTKHKISNSALIIESAKVSLLSTFYAAGFETSYYLPQNLDQMDFKKRTERLSHIANFANSSQLTYLSTALDEYELIREAFPKKALLLWSSRYNLIFNRVTLKKSLKDPSVKIVLYPQLIRNHYR